MIPSAHSPSRLTKNSFVTADVVVVAVVVVAVVIVAVVADVDT